ncbi:hypothetical protein FXO37_25329 [Capsicum annuum]|nr:hypothetical protein FXO37_25329 [Capsicum annuum]
MSDSLTSSKEEQLKKDKGNEHQEHNLWSFIKGKKKQNHVPSTADIKGKKLPVASNHNDCEFKGNMISVIQEVVERAKLEKKMRAKVQA